MAQNPNVSRPSCALLLLPRSYTPRSDTEPVRGGIDSTIIIGVTTLFSGCWKGGEKKKRGGRRGNGNAYKWLDSFIHPNN